MNRIAPTNTRFTTKPPSHSAWATVSFGFAATDPDLDHAGALKFRYRIDGGKWKWAVANAVRLLQPRQRPVPHGLGVRGGFRRKS